MSHKVILFCVFLAMEADKEEKLALKILCTLLGKKEGLTYLYEEHKVTMVAIINFIGLI